MRGLAFRREVRNKVIARKKRICMANGVVWYTVDGMYSKGKIHCGCPACKWGKFCDYDTLQTIRMNTRSNSALSDYYTEV